MGSAVPTGSALIERGDELTRVGAVLDRACDGIGSLAVVEAPSGMGKTALLSESRSMAEASSMRVLRGRGAELEREFAFGVVRQLFEPVLAGASAAEREELLDGAAGFAGQALGLPGAPERAPREGSDWSFAALHGLYWLCANLASARPVCLIVDDAHWCDSSSLRYLAFLMPRLEELRVALLIATRPPDTVTSSEVLETMVSDASTELVRLLPLSAAGVGRLLEDALGAPADAEFVDACLHATRGIPFLLRELTSALQAGNISPTAASVEHVDRIGAETIGRSIGARLGRLPEPAARLARAAAILEQGDLYDAASLAGVPQVEAAEAVDALVVAGILEQGNPLTFVHPIVRTGIYEALPAAARDRGHREAARLLQAVPGQSQRVAEHLLATGPAGEPWAVERLLDSARSAARTGAPETAAVYLARALVETPGAAERFPILLELGMAEATVGRPTWRSNLQEAVAAATDDRERVDASIVLALALSRAQAPDAAVDVLCRTAGLLAPIEDERRVLLEAVAVGCEASNAVPVPAEGGSQRRRLSTRTHADRADCASPEILAVAGFIATLANEPAEVGAGLARRGLAAGRSALATQTDRPWFPSGTWFAWTAVALLVTEHYEELEPLLDASIAEARATGDAGRIEIGLGLRGWLKLRLGDLAGAESDTRTALAASEFRTPTLNRVLNGGVLVMALAEQGEFDAAERVLAHLRNEIESHSLAAAILRYGRGRLRVAQTRIDEGLADFLAVGRLTTEAEITCPGFLAWRTEAALAYQLLGEHEQGSALAAEELELALTFGTQRVLGVSLRAAGLLAGWPEGEALLRSAVAAQERAGTKLDYARSLTDLGAFLRRANRRTEARELLRRGLEAAHRLGARPLAELAETELRATGARPRRVVLTGLEALTASERRVAELASQGLTNREIAQLLFVTTRTVEGHLTSIFRKLQIVSRDQLAAALEGDAPVAA